MRYLKASAILLATSGLAPVAVFPAFAQEAQAEPVRYSAEAFFDTTSCFSPISPPARRGA